MSKKNKFILVKLIINPSAGDSSDTANNLKKVVGYLKKNGMKADVSRAKPKVKATPLARQACKDGYKIVIAMGGDGTVEAVMRGMISRKAHLGIVPVGVENNIAKSLGIPLNLEEACALIASDYTRNLQVAQIKTGKGKSTSFFEMAGVGLSSAMYPDVTKVGGKEISRFQTSPTVPTERGPLAKVFLNLDDERIIQVESMLVMVTNSPAFGKKFLLNPNSSIKDGLLDISVFQGFSKEDLLGYYADKTNGGYSGPGKVRHYQARKLKVKSSPKLKVMADGIELGKGTVTIRMRSDSLRVIAARENPVIKSLPKGSGIPVPIASIEKRQPVPVSPSSKKTIPKKQVTPLPKAVNTRKRVPNAKTSG